MFYPSQSPSVNSVSVTTSGEPPAPAPTEAQSSSPTPSAGSGMTKTEEQYVEQMNIEEVFRAVEAEVADVDKLECFEQHYDAVAPLVKRFLHLEYNDLSRVDQCTWLLLFLAHYLLQREHWKLMNQIPTGESDLVRK